MKIILTAFSEKLKSEVIEIDNDDLGSSIFIRMGFDGPEIKYHAELNDTAIIGVFEFYNEIKEGEGEVKIKIKKYRLVKILPYMQ